MNKILILLGIVLVGLVVFMASQNTPVGGIYSQPGIVDLGSSEIASSSFSKIASTSVGTEILPVNNSRAWAKCQNLGASVAWLGLGNEAIINLGLGLKASESFEIVASNNLYKGSVYAITSSDTEPRINCWER